ncbi:hypothetical protein RV08_GL000863 [Enterococcus mundtii]|nr:hypothetical protein RV08_GL000863 [Enterococcus mundtii]
MHFFDLSLSFGERFFVSHQSVFSNKKVLEGDQVGKLKYPVVGQGSNLSKRKEMRTNG